MKQVSPSARGSLHLSSAGPSSSLFSLFVPPQLLTIVLLLVSACTCASTRCYDEHELSEAANRKLRSHYPQPAEPAAAAAASSPRTCPVELYQQKELPPHLSGRSLSPWRYV